MSGINHHLAELGLTDAQSREVKALIQSAIREAQNICARTYRAHDQQTALGALLAKYL